MLHLPEAVDDININRLLVCRCRGVVEPECFFLQRVKVIGQEHRAVIHFQLPFAVRLEVPYLIGSRLVVAATHQLATYFGGFPDFQPFGYWQRFNAERVRLLNIKLSLQAVTSTRAATMQQPMMILYITFFIYIIYRGYQNKVVVCLIRAATSLTTGTLTAFPSKA